MYKSKISSPARSLGGKSTPRGHKRRTHSVCSPARSENSVKLTALLPDNFVVSPLPKRRSVLNDDTDIEMPRRQSWWRKLNENSRDVMELLEHREVPEGNMMIEENFDVEILSQEKKNYTVDLPESSDCESINSIVIPQRKLFTHKENNPPKKFTHVMNNREELAKLQKSHVDHVNEIDVRPKSLFNQAKKTKHKPIFPPALLNMSTNKSIANKTDLPVVESKGQARNLFGNRPGTKRKNMFADFIVSESEDEIPEIQPKVFGFKKKHEVKQRMSHAAHLLSNSPTTSIIDIDMDDWKHLPSSTMVENHIEDQEATLSECKRLSKLLESKNMENVSVNRTKNKSKLTNESIEPTNRSKQFSSPTNNPVVNTSKKQGTDETNANTFVQLNQSRNNANSSKNMKSFMVEEHTVKLQRNYVNDKGSNQDEIEKGDEHMISGNNKINDIQGQDKEDINITETMKPKNHEGKEDDRNDKTTKNKSYEVSKNSVVQNDENDFSNEDSKQAKHVSESTVSQEIQDGESGDENDEGEDNDDEGEKNDDSEENDDEESENEKVEEMSVSEDEENENVHEISNKNSTNEEKINKEQDSQNQIDVADDNEQIEYRKSDITVSQEIRDGESGDENDEGEVNVDEDEENDDEGEENVDEGEKKDDESEENDDEESENEKVEEMSVSEDEENENVHEISNKDSTNEEKINKEQDHQNQIDVADDNEQIEYRKSDITVSQEIQDGESGDENDEGEENYDEGEENDNEESENEKVGEMSVSEDEENENVHEISNKDSTNEEKINKEQDHHQIDVADDNEQIEYRKSDMSNKEININCSTKITHTTISTSENTNNKVTREDPPEAILFPETNNLYESFILKERNSPRKTKSMIRHPLKPSLAPVRESTGFSDNTGNSSANSGWDSHRTTRKTLRKTFGKDFTPRKSLRTLVMEKAAKYQSFNPEIRDIDQHPNSDSTVTHERKSAKRQSFNPDLRDISQHQNANSTELISREVKSVKRQSFNPDLHDISKHPNANSTEFIAHEVKSAKRQTFNPDLHDISKHPNANSTELLAQEQRSEKRQSFNPDLRDISKHPHANSTELPACDINEPLEQSDVDTGEENQTDLEESDQNINKTMEHSENQSVEKTLEQSDVDTVEENQTDLEESDQNINKTMEHSENRSVEKTLEQSDVDTVEENQTDLEESDQNINKTMEHSENRSVEKSSTELDDDYVNENSEQSGRKIIETNQTETEETMEEFIQKIRQENFDIDKKIREDIANTLKLTANRSCFELSMMPKNRVSKPVLKAKRKVSKTTPLFVVPEAILEDMKYKPPKRFQPRNASWATMRLYKFLESKLEPKYSYMSRVRAEKLVGTIYEFTRQVRRHEVAPPAAVDALKHEMARLKVVDTHYEFYLFFHEYMPREIRVKVNPDPVNKIQMPKEVFGKIIR